MYKYHHIFTASRVPSDDGMALITNNPFALRLAPPGATLAFAVRVGPVIHVGLAEGAVPGNGDDMGLLVLHMAGIRHHRLVDFVGGEDDEDEFFALLQGPDASEEFPASSVVFER